MKNSPFVMAEIIGAFSNRPSKKSCLVVWPKIFEVLQSQMSYSSKKNITL
jgi:hypothetical protein